MMKKFRRGSKIVDFVQRGIKYLDKSDVNFQQVPAESSDTTPEFQNYATNPPESYFQPSTSSHQYIDEDGVCNITIEFKSAPTIQPSTSARTSGLTYNKGQYQIAENNYEPVTSTTLLHEDLYLSDSSNEGIPGLSFTSSSEFLNQFHNQPSLTFANIDNNSMGNYMEPMPGTSFDTNYENILNITTDAAHDAQIDSEDGISKRKIREALPNEWKKNVRKNKRQHGEPYLSAKGSLIPGRTLKESKCMGKCIHKCTSKFTEHERMKIFSSFWNIATVEMKRLYIVSLIQRERIRGRKKKASRKKITNKYFLQKEEDMELIRVCQRFFISTLSVTETFVRVCLKKVIDSEVVVGDKRGKHSPHNKKPNEVRQHVINHINSFPRMPTPRVRKDSKKEFLSHDLNMTKMYNLYRLKCDSEQRECVELAYYRSVFKNEFNIGFHRLGRDVCEICYTVEHMNVKDKENIKLNYKDHLKIINSTRNHFDKAKSLSRSGEIHFVEYDLKAICDHRLSPTKRTRTSPASNFIVLEFGPEKNNIHCFCWHEGIAKKGSSEIGSCLYKYLQGLADNKPVTLMSDTCSSQCRNMYLASLLLYCVETLDIPLIDQKYYEQGHSELETDNVHALIEKTKRTFAIQQPSDYFAIIRKALKKHTNSIYQMQTDDFIDIKYLKTTLIKNAKIDNHGEPVNWFNIRWLQYRKENTKYIYFKYSLDDKKFKKIKVFRRGMRQKNCDEIVLLKKNPSHTPSF